MKGIAAIFYRDYRQRMTNVGFVFWDLLAPLAYLTLFGLGFERMIGSAPILGAASLSYTAFLLPGVLVMVTFSVAMNTSWGFFMDKDSGIFYEQLTYPITRPQILIGKICFNVLLSIIGSLLVMVLGVLAMDVTVRWNLLPLTLLLVVISTATWFYFFSIFAISMRRMDSFNTVTSASYILLMFFSSLFYPLDGLPLWFRAIAYLNPMTWQVDLMRYSLFGGGNQAAVLWLEGIALIAFAAISLGFAVRALNRAA